MQAPIETAGPKPEDADSGDDEAMPLPPPPRPPASTTAGAAATLPSPKPAFVPVQQPAEDDNNGDGGIIPDAETIRYWAIPV